MKAFLTSRAILLQELQNLSKAINEPVDLTGLTSQHDESKFLSASMEVGSAANANSQVPEKMQTVFKVVHLSFNWTYEWFNTLIYMYVSLSFIYASSALEQISNGTVDFSSEYLYSLQNDELYRLFHSLGDQIFFLWSTFLKFHRFTCVYVTFFGFYTSIDESKL